jgi:hypothetical protein
MGRLPDPPVLIGRETAIMRIESRGGRIRADTQKPEELVRGISIIRGDNFDDGTMACLTAFPELQMLFLSCDVTNAGVEDLKEKTTGLRVFHR